MDRSRHSTLDLYLYVYVFGLEGFWVDEMGMVEGADRGVIDRGANEYRATAGIARGGNCGSERAVCGSGIWLRRRATAVSDCPDGCSDRRPFAAPRWNADRSAQ